MMTKRIFSTLLLSINSSPENYEENFCEKRPDGFHALMQQLFGTLFPFRNRFFFFSRAPTKNRTIFDQARAAVSIKVKNVQPFSFSLILPVGCAVVRRWKNLVHF
jgi:hypothetical protein